MKVKELIEQMDDGTQVSIKKKKKMGVLINGLKIKI